MINVLALPKLQTIPNNLKQRLKDRDEKREECGRHGPKRCCSAFPSQNQVSPGFLSNTEINTVTLIMAAAVFPAIARPAGAASPVPPTLAELVASENVGKAIAGQCAGARCGTFNLL